MKSFLSSLRQIDRSWAIFTTRHYANGNRQVSTSRYHEHKLSILGTANNLDRFSTKRSGFRLRWLLQIAGPIACTLGCQLFDVPKSLAAGVTVSGQVFSDVNSNGLIETGDSGIASVTVVLRNTATSICQRVSTNSSGNYSFTSVSAGSYEIIEAGDQLNPTCTPAAGKTLAQTIGKDPTNYASTTSNVIPITVITSDVTAKNFGDHSATSFGNCPNPAYITKGTSADTIRLNSVNLSTGALAEISLADFSAGVNGVGFNLTDAYIYGSASSGTPFNLSRINLSGTIEYLGAVLDVNGANPLTGNSFIGDVDQNGIFYSVQGINVTAIDVNPNSPTFKRYLKKFKLSSNPGINDIAISPIDGKVYTIDNTSTSRLYRYPDFSTISNGGTATIENLGELRNISTNTNMVDGAKGSIYFAADGTLYAYSNNGAIYALSTTNIATPQPKFTTVTTTAPVVSQNDGARCMFAPAIQLPNTYTVSGTLYKDNNNNGVNNSEPGLGANVTVSIYDDKNSNNIIDANEQITTTTSDINGLYTLSNLLAGTYKIKVDTSDVDIPSDYSLSTPNNLSVTVGTANITGKDFGFLIPQVVGFKSAKLTDSNADSKINPGETVTWTIDYVNTGSIDVTNFQITDLLPIGVTKSGAVTLSVGGTGQATPTVNSSYTGTNTTLGTTDTLFTAPITLKVGGMIKVTIPVTINSGISGILSNQSSGIATNLPTAGIKTDNVGVTADLPTTIQNSPYGVTVPTGSISQTQAATVDPTKITVEAVAAPPIDYSDAPSSYGTASHTIVSGTNLGTAITAETTAYNSAQADGDTGDDGITLNGAASGTYVLNASTESATNNTISINPTTNGYANLWIDYNQDGDFADAGEQVLNDNIVTSGTQNRSFDVPTSAVPGYTFARVRYSTTTGTANTPAGTASNGEVEDYVFKVQKTTAPLACSAGSSTIYTSLDFRHFERVDSGTHWARRAGTLPNGKLVDVRFTRSGTSLDGSDTWDAGQTAPADPITQTNNLGNTNRNFQIDVFEAGTSIPVVGNYIFNFADIDGHNKGGTRNLMPATSYTVNSEYQHFFNITDYSLSSDTRLYTDSTSNFPSDLFIQSGASNNPNDGSETTPNTPRPTDSQIAIRVAWENKSQMSFSYFSGQFGGIAIDGQGYNTSGIVPNCNPTVNLSGTVFNDTNSSGIQNTPEVGTNGGGLNAVLLNSSNVVVATTPVAADGTYSFSSVSPATYTVLITTGTTATVTLPTNWVSTGENLNGAADSTVDSKLNVVVASSNVTGANFGIKQRPADVLLLKRITAINGLSTNPNDGKLLTGVLVDANWQTGYVVGATDGGKVKPGDTIEYTIYYLNNGGRNAKSVRICDRLNANQTFYPDTYPNSTFIQNNAINPNIPGSGMQVQKGTSAALTLTNTSDSDGGQFIAATNPVTALPTNCNSLTGAPNNDYGALILDLVTSPGSPNLTALPGKTGQGTPNDSFGLWRFVTKVNKVSP